MGGAAPAIAMGVGSAIGGAGSAIGGKSAADAAAKAAGMANKWTGDVKGTRNLLGDLYEGFLSTGQFGGTPGGVGFGGGPFGTWLRRLGVEFPDNTTGATAGGTPGGLFGFSTPTTEAVQSRMREFLEPDFRTNMTFGDTPFDVLNTISEARWPVFQEELDMGAVGLQNNLGRYGNRLGSSNVRALEDYYTGSLDRYNQALMNLAPQVQAGHTAANAAWLQGLGMSGAMEQAERFGALDRIMQFATSHPGGASIPPGIGASGTGNFLTSAGGTLAMWPMFANVLNAQKAATPTGGGKG